MEIQPTQNTTPIAKIQELGFVQKKYIKNFLLASQKESCDNLKKLIEKISNQEFKLIYPDCDREIEINLGTFKAKNVTPLSEITDTVVDFIYDKYQEQLELVKKINDEMKQKYPTSKNKAGITIDDFISTVADNIKGFTLKSGIVGDFIPNQTIDSPLQSKEIIISNYMSDVSYANSLKLGGNIYVCKLAENNELPKSVGSYLKAVSGNDTLKFILSPTTKLNQPDSTPSNIFQAKESTKTLSSAFESERIQKLIVEVVSRLPKEQASLIPQNIRDFGSVCDSVASEAFYVADKELPPNVSVELVNKTTGEAVASIEVSDVSVEDRLLEKIQGEDLSLVYEDIGKAIDNAKAVKNSDLSDDEVAFLVKRSIYNTIGRLIYPDVKGIVKLKDETSFGIRLKANCKGDYDSSPPEGCIPLINSSIKFHQDITKGSNTTDEQLEALYKILEDQQYELRKQ